MQGISVLDTKDEYHDRKNFNSHHNDAYGFILEFKIFSAWAEVLN